MIASFLQSVKEGLGTSERQRELQQRRIDREREDQAAQQKGREGLDARSFDILSKIAPSIVNENIPSRLTKVKGAIRDLDSLSHIDQALSIVSGIPGVGRVADPILRLAMSQEGQKVTSSNKPLDLEVFETQLKSVPRGAALTDIGDEFRVGIGQSVGTARSKLQEVQSILENKLRKQGRVIQNLIRKGIVSQDVGEELLNQSVQEIIEGEQGLKPKKSLRDKLESDVGQAVSLGGIVAGGFGAKKGTQVAFNVAKGILRRLILSQFSGGKGRGRQDTSSGQPRGLPSPTSPVQGGGVPSQGGSSIVVKALRNIGKVPSGDRGKPISELANRFKGDETKAVNRIRNFLEDQGVDGFTPQEAQPTQDFGRQDVRAILKQRELQGEPDVEISDIRDHVFQEINKIPEDLQFKRKGFPRSVKIANDFINRAGGLSEDIQVPFTSFFNRPLPNEIVDKSLLSREAERGNVGRNMMGLRMKNILQNPEFARHMQNQAEGDFDAATGISEIPIEKQSEFMLREVMPQVPISPESLKLGTELLTQVHRNYQDAVRINDSSRKKLFDFMMVLHQGLTGRGGFGDLALLEMTLRDILGGKEANFKSFSGTAEIRKKRGQLRKVITQSIGDTDPQLLKAYESLKAHFNRGYVVDALKNKVRFGGANMMKVIQSNAFKSLLKDMILFYGRGTEIENFSPQEIQDAISTVLDGINDTVTNTQNLAKETGKINGGIPNIGAFTHLINVFIKGGKGSRNDFINQWLEEFSKRQEERDLFSDFEEDIPQTGRTPEDEDAFDFLGLNEE